MAGNVKLSNAQIDRDQLEKMGDDIFKPENSGIWKSDYYEVDRVVIADGSGEVLLDFIYTLIPN